eukprot:CAMPEP_0174336050 /NCGR_PEP_ID=MMETSP0810-20121108/21273_1 /TAXON_ID=73025 ORGANISM="Eutreptiella gymnastica-like, Strain CCMP1594" /NCGR_SAMPLE_ID=MMETSP0810 /ASSEMBLY_ACC=CAM_ASM_000659 /LENGTH=271 /DNA_ID=CAMNT_0015454797 /DNA_START=219 /DNA_END=1034 /DNA_ORIENTATION=+
MALRSWRLFDAAKPSNRSWCLLHDVVQDFESEYAATIEMEMERYPSMGIVMCTLYNPCFEPYNFQVNQKAANMGVALYNHTLLRISARHRIPVVDLRALCTDTDEFANPIEPSTKGGGEDHRGHHDGPDTYVEGHNPNNTSHASLTPDHMSHPQGQWLVVLPGPHSNFHSHAHCLPTGPHRHETVPQRPRHSMYDGQWQLLEGTEGQSNTVCVRTLCGAAVLFLSTNRRRASARLFVFPTVEGKTRVRTVEHQAPGGRSFPQAPAEWIFES